MFSCPPYTTALVRHCFIGVLYFYWGIIFYRDVEYNFPRKDLLSVICYYCYYIYRGVINSGRVILLNWGTPSQSLPGVYSMTTYQIENLIKPFKRVKSRHWSLILSG